MAPLLRAMPSLGLLLPLMLLAACCVPACHASQLAPPLISPPAEAPFTPLPVLPASRTAYVAIHFEDFSGHQNALDSEASLVGIRVMMRTVADPARGASVRDRVVLVPAHTSESTRRAFAQDGLIVLDMDDRLPHKDICAPKFDRIYLWSAVIAERYDRVVYLDWDVVVQRPMDELFLCGQHCMVFNSVLHFVDGVMVVKPDPAVFDAMLERYKRERLSVLWSGDRKAAKAAALAGNTNAVLYPWHSPSRTMCWEQSYIFFLYWFGNIEAAPLFTPRYGQSPLKLERMAASVQLNAMMWYEKYSWTLMRGKEYRNMSDDQEVPALSLGYTTLKPFHWAPSLFFNLGWDWHDVHDSYFGTSHHLWFSFTRSLLWLFMLGACTKGVRAFVALIYRRRPSVAGASGWAGKVLGLLRRAHLAVLGPTGGFMRQGDGDELVYQSASVWSVSGYWLPQYGSDVIGVLIGGLHCVLLAVALTAQTVLIPQLTPPHLAWRFWFATHTLLVFAFNHWLFLSYHSAPQLQPAALHQATGEMRPIGAAGLVSEKLGRGYPLRSALWLAGWEVLLYVLMRRTFYPEFVVKMLALFPMLAVIIICSINMNRAVWRSVEKAQAQLQGAGASATGTHGVHAPMLPGGGRR